MRFLGDPSLCTNWPRTFVFFVVYHVEPHTSWNHPGDRTHEFHRIPHRAFFAANKVGQRHAPKVWRLHLVSSDLVTPKRRDLKAQSKFENSEMIPPGELTFCHGKSPFFMGKSTISVAIFHCYVKLPEGKIWCKFIMLHLFWAAVAWWNVHMPALLIQLCVWPGELPVIS